MIPPRDADAELQYDDGPGDRRDPGAGRGGDRRRSGWRDFRRAYPGFVFTLLIGLLLLLTLDGYLIYKRSLYNGEVDRLQASMTDAERQKTDAIIAAEENQARIALELARRQAKLEQELHLSVAVDSGRIYLEREGAILRTMPAEFGPEAVLAPESDSIPLVTPRGQRIVVSVGDDSIILDGGASIRAAEPSETRPAPGTVRIARADFSAIRPNLRAGMRVYFY